MLINKTKEDKKAYFSFFKMILIRIILVWLYKCFLLVSSSSVSRWRSSLSSTSPSSTSTSSTPGPPPPLSRVAGVSPIGASSPVPKPCSTPQPLDRHGNLSNTGLYCRCLSFNPWSHTIIFSLSSILLLPAPPGPPSDPEPRREGSLPRIWEDSHVLPSPSQ